jgi:uncharacterized protein
MNKQELEVLHNFLDQLVRVRVVQKIPEADAIIGHAVIQQPDAAYLLVQRALLLEQALTQAKARIAELERGQPSADQSFLDKGLWKPSPGISGPSVQSAGAQGGGPSAASMPSQSGSAQSFLGQAAATAAGVAGGAFLFEGLESLIGHHEAALFDPAAFGAFPPDEVTINNFYAGNDHADADEPPVDSDSDSESDGNNFV